jgi:hypothetical protein
MIDDIAGATAAGDVVDDLRRVYLQTKFAASSVLPEPV